jgi:hypothetical protein
VIGGAGGALFGRRLVPGASHITPGPHPKEESPFGVRGQEPGPGAPTSDAQAVAPQEAPAASASGKRDPLPRLTKASEEVGLDAALRLRRPSARSLLEKKLTTPYVKLM